MGPEHATQQDALTRTEASILFQETVSRTFLLEVEQQKGIFFVKELTHEIKSSNKSLQETNRVLSCYNVTRKTAAYSC